MILCDKLCKSNTTRVETVHALAGVSINVHPGEFVVVKRSSGSGKTTLINVIAGIITPDSGSATVLDCEVTGLSGAKRADLRLKRLGVVFQDDNLLADLTAVENVVLPMIVQGLASQEAKAAAQQQLSRLGLNALADRYPVEMSGGQRQRVGIARALVGGKPLLLADEPTGSLDSVNGLALFGLIADLCEDGIGALVASHDSDILTFAHRVYEMKDGRVVDERSL